MFLFKRINKRIQTGNNGRGPGGPRLPSDRRDADDRWLAQRQEFLELLVTPKFRSATVADGFVRLPPNDGDLANVPRAG